MKPCHCQSLCLAAVLTTGTCGSVGAADVPSANSDASGDPGWLTPALSLRAAPVWGALEGPSAWPDTLPSELRHSGPGGTIQGTESTEATDWLETQSLSLHSPASPEITTWTQSFAVNQAVPDASFTGLSDTQNLALPDAEILSLTVSLELSPRGDGGFVGDLYVTLQHDGGGYVVLLNRPGRGPDAPFGYSDDVGIQIDLSSDALADIHQYRLALNGDENQPIDTPLSGWWQADGRSTDPLEVSTGDPRDATFNSFIGTLPSGGWTLFVADVSAGGAFQLDAWSVSVTLVPEPTVPVLVLLGAALLCLRHRRSHPGS